MFHSDVAVYKRVYQHESSFITMIHHFTALFSITYYHHPLRHYYPEALGIIPSGKRLHTQVQVLDLGIPSLEAVVASVQAAPSSMNPNSS